MRSDGQICNAATRVAIAMVLVAGSTAAVAQTEAVIHTFEVSSDGASPWGGLIADSAGNLYGVALSGPNNGWGSVFELSPPPTGNKWTETVLHGFTGTPDGNTPQGPLVMDKAGNLYGTTTNGGNYFSYGTVFELSPPAAPGDAWTEKVIYAFQAPPDGNIPGGGLLLDSVGNLYGATGLGGACGNGAIFELSPPSNSGVSWTEKLLYSFGGHKCKTANDGRGPSAVMAMGSDGALYGTTWVGGAATLGMVFKLTPPAAGQTNWTEKILYSFTGGSDGWYPESGLVLYHSNLYGTAKYGANSACFNGVQGCGTVFELSPPTQAGGSWTETTIYSFTGGNDGDNPVAGVVFDKHGNLYTAGGVGGNSFCEPGSTTVGCGAVIRLAPPAAKGDPWTETTLYTFTGRADGGTWPSTLVFGLFNRLYGTTYAGGDATCNVYGTLGCGVVFKIIP